MRLRYDMHSKEYTLILDKGEELPKCFGCKIKLEIPFYICEETNRLYCEYCEHKSDKCTYSKQSEHLHFKVMKIKKQKV